MGRSPRHFIVCGSPILLLVLYGVVRQLLALFQFILLLPAPAAVAVALTSGGGSLQLLLSWRAGVTFDMARHRALLLQVRKGLGGGVTGGRLRRRPVPLLKKKIRRNIR